MSRLLSPALLLLIACASSALGQGIRVGQPYPDFQLPQIDGRKPVALSDFRGKKVLLIHFASW